MTKIENEHQYETICKRINELLKIVNGNTDVDNKDMRELDMLSDLAADYEEAHYPVKEPTLAEVLKERMYELGLSQSKIAKMIHVSPSSVSEYLSGKREPTMKVGREIHNKLGVDANVILGV